MKRLTWMIGILVLTASAGPAFAGDDAAPAAPLVALSDGELDEVAAAGRGHGHGHGHGHGGSFFGGRGGLDLRGLGPGASPVFVLNLVIAITQQIAIGNIGPVVQIAQNAAQGVTGVGSLPR